jgi:hypothetical protein
MKNSNDIIGNRTRDLPTCSAVPQLTALPRAPYCIYRLVSFNPDWLGGLGGTKGIIINRLVKTSLR